jgi:hypothetical protein
MLYAESVPGHEGQRPELVTDVSFARRAASKSSKAMAVGVAPKGQTMSSRG